MPLTKNVLKPLAKSVLVPSGLTAAMTTIDVAIQKKVFPSVMRPSGLEKQTTLIVSNAEMNYIMRIIKSHEEAGLLIKSVSETIKNEAK